MNDTIYIRTDANEKIATGHLMRCMSVASSIVKNGGKVCFIFADEQSLKLQDEFPYEYVILDSVWNNLEQEIDSMISLIRKEKIRKIFVDSYFASSKYLERLEEYANVYYLDDMQKEKYKITGVISYAIGLDENLFRKWYDNEETTLYRGSKYIPMRDEFSNIPEKEINFDVRNILITVGGSDSGNVIYRLVKLLVANDICEQVKLHIVIGRYIQQIQNVEKIAEDNRNIVLYKNCNTMSKLMQECDFAISATGTTIYELAACSVPTINIVIADNQKKTAEYLGEQGAVMYAGEFMLESVKEGEMKLIECIKSMMDVRVRENFSKKIHMYSDGFGANRIAKILMGEKQNGTISN